MIIKQDKRFLRAADAQLAVWRAEDAGEHDNESAKLHRRLVEQLSDDYGLSRGTVSALIGRQTLADYLSKRPISAFVARRTLTDYE